MTEDVRAVATADAVQPSPGRCAECHRAGGKHAQLCSQQTAEEWQASARWLMDQWVAANNRNHATARRLREWATMWQGKCVLLRQENNKLRKRVTRLRGGRPQAIVNGAGWIAVDLDGTLAVYGAWVDDEHIGAPVPEMVARVREWLEDGIDVRIFTARVAFDPDGSAAAAIKRWCLEHIGRELPVTCSKDYGTIQLWDDRAVRVRTNTGEVEGAP